MSAPTLKQLIKTGLLLGLMATLPGCSTWFGDGFKSPEVQLTKVEVIKARALEQHFVLRYRIDNPNNVSLPIRGLTYRVQLDNVELASGDSTVWVEIPANGHAYYEVPVQTNLWKQAKQVVRLLKKSNKPIHYNLDGEIRSGMMFGRTVPISSQGELNSPVTTVALD